MARYKWPTRHGVMRKDDITRFRIWAPDITLMSLQIQGHDPVPMQALDGGWHEYEQSASAGTRYKFILPDGLAVPDPASRCQDGDVHGWSIVTDPATYVWKHTEWKGRPWHEAILYELHPGAFGGFKGIVDYLPSLKTIGITALELMPLADFPGARNWGYDGVLPYAPDTAYGSPDDLKALIDTAHGLGLMVYLDVVYNHFGPDGAYAHVYAKDFFDESKHTPWGAAIDFTRSEVQDYFVDNALYWLNEFRFDGLRFDATHAIEPQSFLPDMARLIREQITPSDRHVHLMLEHEGNVSPLLRPAKNGAYYDAQWTDDFHHCLHVLLTGETEGYYEDFEDATNLLARCLSDGFAYQGEVSRHSGQHRGHPADGLPTTAFIICLQNHDQIGNRAMGERLITLTDHDALRAATALQILMPQIPLLYMGEEWESHTPFLFFTDHHDELADAVREGRRAEFKHFSAFQDPEKREHIPDPNAETTFTRSIPDFSAAQTQQGRDALAFRQILLSLRHTLLLPRLAGTRSAGVDILGQGALLARWKLGDGALMSIGINLGTEPVPLPPIAGKAIFSTRDPSSNHTLLPVATTALWFKEASAEDVP
ncbi:malto-oligosyltrehalose trehalohydrolase [Granulibacter bethesdensis]|uniref:Malto-oligosyltrehalose trehalohydrolase n=1 Tax=Granulibacter bethesdensis (strain ATCC BAA-1260 / CGDNIH1) TaxID=391165 RepID=Q0BU55_GRABC|nr:malto-oligosyltrehalose trehalohydrolase [Granulibacter bethesdensis]ABI61647.1 Malto-oligosyltrehalose trehalohydrolase [Granulibacter bethesdensis CGDNIH1]AHJ69535.1 Malto-oligosyltrehalose trehalohydrolase [Granulibacter bethesdensis]APH51452.1 Malto-oligosyltrehalose trehalohydrolase [Granulibacter bethesdensis]APH64145.1 Malto-oligosyltrehalose trehalohydrolase [Granulibacter bethesdensis]